MRCYFHLVNHHETILDESGVEVPNLETARSEAFKAIGELRREAGGEIEEWSGWRLDIVCPEGNLLCSLPLDVVLH